MCSMLSSSQEGRRGRGNGGEEEAAPGIRTKPATSCMADSLCHSPIEMPNKLQFTFAFGLLTTLLLCVVPSSEKEQGRQDNKILPCLIDVKAISVAERLNRYRWLND